MQRMSKSFMLLSAVVLLGQRVSAYDRQGIGGSNVDLKLGGEILIPAEDDDWDVSAGVSGRWILWSPEAPQIGLALSVGGQSWQINEEQYWDGNLLLKVSGDATMIPLGASLVARAPMGQAAWLAFEGGLRYVFVDSSVKFEERVYTNTGRPVSYWSGDIEIDDGIIGLVNAEVELPIGIGIALYGGAGYQFDISKGKMSLNGIDIDYKNSLEALVFSAGLKLEF